MCHTFVLHDQQADGKLVFSLRLAGTLEILFWRNILSLGGCRPHSVSWGGHPLKVRGEASPAKNGGDSSPLKVKGVWADKDCDKNSPIWENPPLILFLGGYLSQ